MEQTKKAFIAFIEQVEEHLEDGTIYGEVFKEQLKKAKKEAGIETKKDDTYSDSSPGHILE